MTIRSVEYAQKLPMMGEKSAIDDSMDETRAIDYYMPKCIRPKTGLQKAGRALVSLVAVVGAAGYSTSAFLVWRRLADKCIAILMIFLAVVWVMIGLRRSLKHLEFYAKISLSLMCTSIGMLLCLPIHVASLEVLITGDYQTGMFFGVRISVVIFFFATAFWYLAWICFAADRVLFKVNEILTKKREDLTD